MILKVYKFYYIQWHELVRECSMIRLKNWNYMIWWCLVKWWWIWIKLSHVSIRGRVTRISDTRREESISLEKSGIPYNTTTFQEPFSIFFYMPCISGCGQTWLPIFCCSSHYFSFKTHLCHACSASIYSNLWSILLFSLILLSICLMWMLSSYVPRILLS